MFVPLVNIQFHVKRVSPLEDSRHLVKGLDYRLDPQGWNGLPKANCSVSCCQLEDDRVACPGGAAWGRWLSQLKDFYIFDLQDA